MLAEAEELARQAQAKKAATVSANRAAPGAAAPGAAAHVPTAPSSIGTWCIFTFSRGCFTRLPQYSQGPPVNILLNGKTLAPDQESCVRRYENGSVVAYFTKPKALTISAKARAELQGVAVDAGHYQCFPHHERLHQSERCKLLRLVRVLNGNCIEQVASSFCSPARSRHGWQCIILSCCWPQTMFRPWVLST